MEKNFPTGDDRQPPQNIGVVPATLMQTQERGGTLDICEKVITATNAIDVGISNFNNMTDHTGQGGEGCTDVTKRGRNISGNKITAKGGKGVGISNFDNCTLHKNSNDEDDAAAGRKKKSPA
ncbi:PREDICTED: PRUPE_1G120000 [Prunus dulcis]|uniref:PREDICTED: PRUPE_1G120000 n=1 Tax=Prunus dulcis TaxID=3755 RepID=A0A5E4G7Y7_PRUDU|nr:hypothetical protein L3X38_002144 [Prunus dulcis]VVA35897.1 PREDICTED: PRUPE_1G120000 [Prunus dulcis]